MTATLFEVFHLLCSSGNVVTMECVEKLIKKDMIDPTNGKSLAENDIIPLQRASVSSEKLNETLFI